MILRVRMLVVALSLALAFGATADARPKRRVRKAHCPKGSIRMSIAHTSKAHLFFSAGSAKGLAVGTAVGLYRRGRKVGGCTIDVAAAGNARCEYAETTTMDVACYQRGAPAVEAKPEWQAGPGRGEATATAQADFVTSLARQGVPRVVDEGTPVTGLLSVRADAALQHVSFTRVQGPSGTTHRQQIYASARNIDLGFFDTRASIDLSVVAYLDRPEQVRFRPENSALLYVHETSVSRRAVDGGLVVGAGRLRPRYAPGIAYLDGAQVGFRFSERLELGVLAGGLPDLVRLKPSLSRWMAGAYGRWFLARTKLRWDLNGRLGMVRGETGGTQGEAEAYTRLGWGRGLALSTAARAYAGSAGFVLASLRGRVDVQAGADWHLSLAGRFREDTPDPYAAGLATVGARHARASVGWKGLKWLTVSMTAGYGELFQDDLTRVVVGPQLGMPRLLGTLGGVWFGYQEALGWLPGHRAWAQVKLHPHRSLRIWVRSSYREDHQEAGVLRELGGFVQADWRLSSLFRVRGSLLSRLGLSDLGSQGSGAGFVGRVSLIAAL